MEIDYSEELKRINTVRCRIAKISKCKSLASKYSYNFWLKGLIFAAVIYAAFFLIIFASNVSFIGSLIGGAILSGIIDVILLPTFILSIIQTVKLKRLLSSGDIIIGLIIEIIPGLFYRNGYQKAALKYCYLNDRGSVETSTTKCFVRPVPEIAVGKKVLVAYNNKRSAILSKFYLEDDTAMNADTEKEFDGLSGKSMDYKAFESDLAFDNTKMKKQAKALIGIGIFFAVLFSIVLPIVPKEDPTNPAWIVFYILMPCIGLALVGMGIYSLRKAQHEAEKAKRTIACASVTAAKIITSNVFQEKSKVTVQYCFIDQNGARRTAEQMLFLYAKLPGQVWAAYNPQNPDESILLKAPAPALVHNAGQNIITRQITVIRPRKFWASGVKISYYVDGNIIAEAKNGQTVNFNIDDNRHELYAAIIGANYNGLPNSSNIVILESGNRDETINFSINNHHWLNSQLILTKRL